MRAEFDRRTFLKVTALSGAGFLIGCREQSAETAAPAPAAEPASAAEFNPFVRIATDDTVTVVVKHLDKGQGVTTGLPTIVAEELDAAWAQMRFEFAPADAGRYNNLFWGPMQGTGGSSSIANSWTQLRTAAAGARAMLTEAAARRWGVPAAEIRIAGGVLSHGDRSARFGELAAEAATITPPEKPPLKSPDDFRLIGTHVPRLDSASKTDGSATFTIDVERPGAVVAVVAHPPRFGARVGSFDDGAARAVAGVADVVEIPRGVAVLADSYFSATRGRDALEIEWDETQAEKRGSDELIGHYRELLAQPGGVARNDGDVEAAFAGAARTVEAEFTFPYLAHATMEPMDCVVELGPDRCDIWTGCQVQTMDQNAAARITGLSPDKVHIHTLFAGGSFGRRAVPDSDFVAEAVMIAKAIGGRAPVKLQWSREDDMRGGRYRPMSVHRLRAALDPEGRPLGWSHRLAIQSILKGTPFEGMVQNGIDATAVEGARGLPYGIPNLRVEAHSPEVGVPTLWWRSVGHTHNGFVTEVFVDQLAAAAGRDPVEFRRELLAGHPRHLGVLERAAAEAGWGAPLGEGRARGIAVHESFGSFVAEVAEIRMNDDGGFAVERVVCAVDCGIAVNPDVIRAQMEGGIAYGLSAALREQITLVEGRVQEGNFDRYRPLRISEMPRVEVHIVASTEPPTGVGEPGVPPIAPAVANALYAATGEPVTALPFRVG